MDNLQKTAITIGLCVWGQVVLREEWGYMFNGWLNTSESTLNILTSLNTYDFIYQIIIMIIIVFFFDVS